MPWVIVLVLVWVPTHLVAGTKPSAKLVFERTDCIKRLEGAREKDPNTIVLAVREQRRVREISLPALEGMGWLKGAALQMGANSFLSGQSASESHPVPGRGIIEEKFVFTPVQAGPGDLWVDYEMVFEDAADAGGGSARVQVRAAAEFTQGNWDDFLAGREVVFGFTPKGWKCFERVMGPHLESGSPSLAEKFYVALSCANDTDGVGAEQQTNRVQAPARFEGTRYRMLFLGPSSRVEVDIGVR